MWSQLTAEQKKTYGEDYYEAAMTSVDKYSKEVSCFRCRTTNSVSNFVVLPLGRRYPAHFACFDRRCDSHLPHGSLHPSHSLRKDPDLYGRALDSRFIRGPLCQQPQIDPGCTFLTFWWTQYSLKFKIFSLQKHLIVFFYYFLFFILIFFLFF